MSHVEEEMYAALMVLVSQVVTCVQLSLVVCLLLLGNALMVHVLNILPTTLSLAPFLMFLMLIVAQQWLFVHLIFHMYVLMAVAYLTLCSALLSGHALMQV